MSYPGTNTLQRIHFAGCHAWQASTRKAPPILRLVRQRPKTVAMGQGTDADKDTGVIRTKSCSYCKEQLFVLYNNNDLGRPSAFLAPWQLGLVTKETLLGC